MPKPLVKRWLRFFVVACAVAAVAALAMIKARPHTFRRTALLPRDGKAAARFTEEVLNPIGNVMADESGRTPLDLALTEESVNAYKPVLLRLLRDAGGSVPPVVERLRVAFEPGHVVLAAPLGEGWGEVIVTVRLTLAADDEGRLLARVVGVRAGLLPAPPSQADHLTEVLRGLADDVPAGEGEEPKAQFLRKLRRSLEGKPVRLTVRHEDKTYGVRLERIEIERGRLHVVGRRIERREEGSE
jgi:hypothetical protein